MGGSKKKSKDSKKKGKDHHHEHGKEQQAATQTAYEQPHQQAQQGQAQQQQVQQQQVQQQQVQQQQVQQQQVQQQQVQQQQQQAQQHQVQQQQYQSAGSETKIATTISASEAKAAADACRNAMKGLGTNEKMLIDNIGNKTSADMQLVVSAYKAAYNRDFVADLKSECSGKFLEVLIALSTPPADYDAMLVKKAIAGLGTDESLLSEVLCTRTQTELKEAAAAYQRLYGKSMEAEIKSDTSGDLAKVYVNCLAPSRGTRHGDVAADVDALYKAGGGKIGTDEATFINIIATASPAHLEAIFYAYAQKYGKSLDTVIRDEMGGDTGKALANLATPPHVFFSDKITHAMKGIGTEDEKLIRLLTTQRGRHLKAAGKHFLEVNKRTISAWVADETSGDYKALLLKMCAAEGV